MSNIIPFPTQINKTDDERAIEYLSYQQDMLDQISYVINIMKGENSLIIEWLKNDKK